MVARPNFQLLQLPFSVRTIVFQYTLPCFILMCLILHFQLLEVLLLGSYLWLSPQKTRAFDDKGWGPQGQDV